VLLVGRASYRRPVLVGAHLKGDDPVSRVAAVGGDCAQLFLSNPQSWKPPAPRSDADDLRRSGLPLYVHAPYLVNLASPNPRIRVPSRRILAECCAAAEAIGARAVIVHGGHAGAADDVAEGAARWVRALKGLEASVPVYVENTAGGAHALARRFDDLARLWDAIGRFDDVGFCLDTCHAHAAGEELTSAVDRALAITGRIDLVHCNDSKDGPGSGRDRHENLGAGQIPVEALIEIVRRAGAPVVCETPTDGVKDDIALLRAALG
jgi:deoxyribonuclease-4